MLCGKTLRLVNLLVQAAKKVKAKEQKVSWSVPSPEDTLDFQALLAQSWESQGEGEGSRRG